MSALLVGMNRTPDAIEAAWKYLILGTIGVGFALLATLLAYASSVHVMGESSDALNWTRLIAIAPSLNPNLLRLSFVFALAGYGTKAGLVPFGKRNPLAQRNTVLGPLFVSPIHKSRLSVP